MSNHCILALDQGTTSSRAIVFDDQANIVTTAQQEFPQIYPETGWVEHDPEAIWSTTLETARQAVQDAARQAMKVAAIGITNQRETTVVWDRSTGKPIYNAIVWQDRRTTDQCDQLKSQGLEPGVQSKTGLLLDPYFSATKLNWILDNVKGARDKADRGELAFGTVDTFLIWRLTGGKVHATDATNASRTNLYNIHTGQWDAGLLGVFNIPDTVLPRVLDSSDDFGSTPEELFGESIPIHGVAGDQHAATIGQCCFESGEIKSTYGTGCFVMMNTGAEIIASKNRLLTTVAYQLDGKRTYAIEGSIFVAGAAIQWLRDGIGIIDNARDTGQMAESLEGNQGVYMVPAFTGLGAPYWKPEARGAIFGITRGTGPAEIARAALESVCYLTHDLFDAMAKDGTSPTSLRVDGGMVANDWLLQFLSDVLDLKVIRPQILETTALGAAYLAGRKAGVFGDLEDFQRLWRKDGEFDAKMGSSKRENLLSGWRDAMDRVV